MISKLSYYISEGCIPYENQGIEEYLLRHVEPGECILYLWQNQNTVVIGKNQNARTEVRVDALEAAGGFLARRLSGGGAVYHDLGNLNFTFLVRKEDYDVDRQSRVILNMARSFGLDAEKTGRNDILVDGKKFSGNAYYETGGHCYHHGTIMIDVDKTALSNYLNVPLEKLQSKGVQSVRSRVVNLKELKVDIDVESVKTAMVSAFEEVYGFQAIPLGDSGFSAKADNCAHPNGAFDSEEIEELTAKFASEEWRLGREFPFSFSVSRRFDWGGIEICIAVKDGKVDSWQIYSDALDDRRLEEIEKSLRGELLGKEYRECVIDEVLQSLDN